MESFILTQSGILVNMKHMMTIHVSDRAICYEDKDAMRRLGVYEDADRAKAVFAELIAWISCDADTIPFEGINNVFYMPEV